MRAVVAHLETSRPSRRAARALADELDWKGFSVEHGSFRAGAAIDGRGARLVVPVFPVLPAPLATARPPRGVLDSLRGLAGLTGSDVALLATSPVLLGVRLQGLAQVVEQAGARVVAVRFVAPIGGHKAIEDLATECMVRIPR